MEIHPAPVSLSPLRLVYKWVGNISGSPLVTKTTKSVNERLGCIFKKKHKHQCNHGQFCSQERDCVCSSGLSGRRVWGRQQCWQTVDFQGERQTISHTFLDLFWRVYPLYQPVRVEEKTELSTLPGTTHRY